MLPKIIIHWLIWLNLQIYINSQSCISISGQPIDWWASLVFPKNIPGEYLYLDSSFVKPQFIIRDQNIDFQSSGFSHTLLQINKLKLKFIAWNDQSPNGTVTSSKAHSKGLLAFNQRYDKGFYFGHSIPLFPNFTNNQISTSIGNSQRMYGQHAICISLNGVVIKQFINKIIPMRPFIYATNLKENQLIGFSQIEPPNYGTIFSHIDYSIKDTNLKFIFKNGGYTASIFESGLNIMLNSSILAQTWGRPLQSPWCKHKLYVYQQLNLLETKQRSLKMGLHYLKQLFMLWRFKQDGVTIEERWSILLHRLVYFKRSLVKNHK